MQKKYLFVLPTARIGGAERVTFNLIIFLLRDKNNIITLVTMSRGKQESAWEELLSNSNFNWIIGYYKSEKSSLIPTTLKLIKLSKTFQFDYIFSTHIHVNSYLGSLKSIGYFKESHLISRESFSVFEKYNKGYKKFVLKRRYRFLYGSQDLLICQTEVMKNSLIKNLGFNPVKKIDVIPNPVNLDYIRSSIQDTIREEKLIIACGRLVNIKQHDLLIEAFDSFSKVHPSYNLVILGSGPLEDKLKDQLALLKLSNKVKLLGNVKNPYEWFAKAEIGVISSKREGFPNTLLEMMASGTSKIVTTPCAGGLSDIPGLIVTNDTTAESILEGLNRAATLSIDTSPVYQKYILKNHSVRSFWNRILQNLHD